MLCKQAIKLGHLDHLLKSCPRERGYLGHLGHVAKTSPFSNPLLHLQSRPFLASPGHRASTQASACHRESDLASQASQATRASGAEREILGQKASEK